MKHSQPLHPHLMNKDAFVKTFGDIFELSHWVASEAYDCGLGSAQDTAEGLHKTMCSVFKSASLDRRKSVLSAHPDLAGHLMASENLTAESAAEQTSAGLLELSDDEKETFVYLNTRYREIFGFPFIIAVKGLDSNQILTAFKSRINNDADTEFEIACCEVEKIARFRLEDILGK